MLVLDLSPEAETLADAVALAVREGIADGRLVPDHTYSVYQLAEALQVSRSPVREALLRLAEAGLVRIRRNRGFQVILPRAHDVEEIFEIRIALEPGAARRAAERADDEQREVLQGLLDTMREAARDNDPPRFWTADKALHRSLLLIAGNARAASVIDQLRATTALLGPPSTATGRTLEQIVTEHERVVRAVLERDPDAAENRMREHLEHTAALLVRGLQA